MGAPDPLTGVHPEAGSGESAGPPLDQNSLHTISDNLVRELGQNSETFRGQYDEILSAIQAQGLGGFAAPESIAASDLVATPTTFLAWSNSVGLFSKDGTHPEVLSEIDGIKDKIRYPKSLLAIETKTNARGRNVQDFAHAVKNWTTFDQSIKWDETFQVPDLWKHLLFSWSHSKNAVDKNHNEASQRSLVDAMMQLVFFQCSNDVGYEVLLEMPVALPRPPGIPTIVTRSAEADTIVLRAVPRPLNSAIEDELIAAGFGWKITLQCLYHPIPGLHIGAFAMESGRSGIASVDSRVAMDLCSIQHQRRILGLQDKCVYGATYSGGNFSLFTSRWAGEYLTWMPVSPCKWDLKNPVQFIQCLYFLWELKKHLDESFEDDFNTLDANKVKSKVITQTPFWRFIDEPNLKEWGNDGTSQGSSSESCPDVQKEASENVEIADYDHAADDAAIADGTVDSAYNLSRVPRTLTLQDIIINLPFIYDQLMRIIRIEEWKKSITANENGGT